MFLSFNLAATGGEMIRDEIAEKDRKKLTTLQSKLGLIIERR